MLGGRLATPAWAQEFAGARVVGLSDSQRALTNGNDALYLNPGGMPLSSVYALELNYVDDLEGGDRRINASILDSQAGELSGGVAYTFASKSGEHDASRVSHRIDAGLGLRIDETAGLGAVLRYVTSTAKLGDTKLEDQSYGSFTADFGAQYRSEMGIGVGAAIYNVFAHEAPKLPFSWGAGIGYDSGELTAELDLRHDLRAQSFRVSIGGGAILGESFVLRAGGGFETKTEVVDLSAGFGYGTKEAGFELGFTQRVSGDDPTKPERLLALGVRLYFF